MANEALLGTIVVGVSAGGALGAVVATAISLSWQARHHKGQTQVLVEGKTVWVQLDAEQIEAVLRGAEKRGDQLPQGSGARPS
jgi:hypothetical protein